MEKKKNIILGLLLMLVMSHPAFGMKYKILLLNTPTITIDNRQSKVGDWFDDESVIKWDNERQAMKVMSEDNHRYTVSPTAYKEAGAKKFKDYITFVKPMAHRGMSNLKEELAERLEGYHVLMDEIEFDLSDIDLPEDAVLSISSSSEMTNSSQPIVIREKNLIITRDGLINLSTNSQNADNSKEFVIFLDGQPITYYFEVEIADFEISEN